MTTKPRKKSYRTPAFKMKESLPKASAILLVISLLFILFNVATLVQENRGDKYAPQAVKGYLDLSTINLEESPSIPLSGNWSFYWGHLYTPEQIAQSDIDPDYLSVPHTWVREAIDGQPLSTHGVATYQLTIETGQFYNHLVLDLPTIGTAYTLYLNNDVIANAGKIGTDKQNSEPGYNARQLLLEPDSSTLTLTLLVSNFDYKWGGQWETIRIGSPESLVSEQYQQILRSTFLVGIFLTVALFNLIQFTLRTADPLPIIIALTCVSLGLREIESSQLLHITGLLSWSFDTNIRVNFLTFYLTMPIMMSYFHISFWQEYNKKIMATIYVVSCLFSLLVLLTPPDVFSLSMQYFQALTAFVLPFVMWGLIQAVRHQRRSARMMLIGTIFMFLVVVNDILYNLDIIDTALAASFGLVAFVLCQNYLTYIRFINTFRQNEFLSETLEKRNKELEGFSQSLEEKVQLRTDELAKANERLEELAHQDMLTGLPNRRGMSKPIEDALVHFRQKNTPFCLLIIDFDKFKELNDTLGHEAGDKVLSEGAEVMRKTLRGQDVLGRWGGEEFLLLLPGTPLKGATILAEKLKNKTAEYLSELIKREITVTLGVAQIREDETIDSCLKRADEALYEGKSKGRNRVEVAPA